MNTTAGQESIADMSGRELDALVAEHVFGWHDIKPAVHAAGGFGSDWRGKPQGRRRMSDEKSIPCYSADAALMMEVECRIEALGPAAMHAYSCYLSGAVWLDSSNRPNLRGWHDWRDTWAIIGATFRERCIAAIAAAKAAQPESA